MIAKMQTTVWTFRSPSRLLATLALVALTAGAALVGCEKRQMSSEVVASSDLVTVGQRIFRFDTFGNEQLWTETLRLHENVDPTTALTVGLKVDADVLPPGILKKVDLKSPATTARKYA